MRSGRSAMRIHSLPALRAGSLTIHAEAALLPKDPRPPESHTPTHHSRFYL